MARKYYVYGSGTAGCLYDYGPHFAASKADAIKRLWLIFSEAVSDYDARHMRAALRRHGIYYFRDRAEAGADYCELSECAKEDYKAAQEAAQEDY